MNNERKIYFITNNASAYVDQCLHLVDQGFTEFTLRPFNERAMSFVEQISKTLSTTDIKKVHFFAESSYLNEPLPQGVSIKPEDTNTDVSILFCDEKIRISALLLDYLNAENCLIIAPIISIHSSLQSLFLISIPKAGTHLIYELAQALGYNAGVACPDKPDPQNWYCLQGTNSHTEAKDFLLESAKHHYFAQRNHPFAETPTLMIYRNPLDIVVSEANYYHKAGNTVFSGYLDHLNFEQRLMKLIDDPWLLGSIRDRVSAFIPWLSFKNVIPVSFEELVGEQGGGTRVAQEKLIWSLLLKLHISGNPNEIAQKVFNKDSATFHHGHLDSHKEKFTKEAYEKFAKLPQDFMQEFGYGLANSQKECLLSPFSSRIEEFINRPLEIDQLNFDDLPIAAKHHVKGHNIIKFQGIFIAIPISNGDIDLRNTTTEQRKGFLHHENINQLKHLLNNIQ